MPEFEIQTQERMNEILRIMFEQQLMPVLGKDELEMDDATLREQLLGKGEALVDAGVSVIEGTCRANNYRTVVDILADAPEQVPGFIPAMGTQSNIVSIHYAVERGIPVIVAADGMPMLSGDYALPQSQREDAQAFVAYVEDNSELFAQYLGLDASKAETFAYDALNMDPIAYCIARNVVCFPGWSTRNELGALFARGARTTKAFPFNGNSPKAWDGLTAAVSSDYDVEIPGIMGTGGLKIEAVKDTGLTEEQMALQDKGNLVIYDIDGKPYVDTITPCLATKHFKVAGSSDLGKGTIDKVAETAKLYVARVKQMQQG